MKEPQDRGKRRSAAQRIGKEGEVLFELWAVRQGLTTNRAEEDLGVDFFCQVLVPVGNRGSEEAIGRVLGVQVKSTDHTPEPSLVLDRVDAVNLLRQTQATCIVGVQLRANKIRFRFVDAAEIDRLIDFLNSGAETVSLRFDLMESDTTTFKTLLHKITNPSTQQQLRIHIIQRRMTVAIPGAEMTITHSSADTLCQVALPWIDSAFNIKRSTHGDVRLRVLEHGDPPFSLPGVSLKPEIVSALEATDGHAWLVGTQQRSEKITVEWQGKHASATAMVRHFGDELAYVFRAGLRFGFSAPRRTSEGRAHVLECALFAPKSRVPLTSSMFTFLRLFRPGARLLLGRSHREPIETWGKNLVKIGPAVEAVRALSSALSIEFDDFQLVDLYDEEFGWTLGFLDSFLLQAVPMENLVPGFVVGPMAKVPPEQVPSRGISFTVPVVMNWKNTGIVIRVSCEGTGFLMGDLFCGFRIEKQSAWKWETTKRFQKSVRPELWFGKNWPAIRIGDKGVAVNRESDITLEARID